MRRIVRYFVYRTALAFLFFIVLFGGTLGYKYFHDPDPTILPRVLSSTWSDIGEGALILLGLSLGGSLVLTIKKAWDWATERAVVSANDFARNHLGRRAYGVVVVIFFLLF